MNSTEIVFTSKQSLKGYTLIEGFPGIGLVGTIAAGYAVEKKKMKPIGYIYSDKFPPMTTIHHGRPYFPARIYLDTKDKFCVILAEFVVPATIVYDLAQTIMDLAKKEGIKQIVSLAGMTSPKPEGTNKVYGIASNDKISKELETKKIEMIKEGVTTGVSGILIAKCAASNFPAMSLLAETKQGFPDPSAAVTVLQKLGDIIGLKVDTADLTKEAKTIEERLRQLMEQSRQTHPETEIKRGPNYPSMYE